jgi:hypothetical protein
MTTIEKLKSEIAQLSDKELTVLSDWLVEVEEQRFDRRIERDAAAGKLDKLMASAEANYRAGKRRLLKVAFHGTLHRSGVLAALSCAAKADPHASRYELRIA